MTVSTTTNINRYTGNGTTTVYPYTFKVLYDTDMIVLVDGVLQVQDTDYEISGISNDSGGNITFKSGHIPASSAAIIIYRDSDIIQPPIKK